jgi:DNA invertase Pin-like site-specific DNA recombinase
MNKAILYARVASDTLPNSEMALENQITTMRQYAEKNNLQVVEVIKEVERSKKNLASVKEFAEVIKQSGGTHLLITNLDRITRNSKLYLKFCKYLEKDSITLHQTEESTFMSNMQSCMAKFESEVLSKRIKAGIARKKELVEAKKDTETKPAVNPQALVWTKADPWRMREVRRREREKRAQRRAR